MDLVRLANEMCDVFHRAASHRATDRDVNIRPRRPEANDRFAATTRTVDLPWTRGTS